MGWCSNILQGEHNLELRSKNLVPRDPFLISQNFPNSWTSKIRCHCVRLRCLCITLIISTQNEVYILYNDTYTALITKVFELPTKPDIKHPPFFLYNQLNHFYRHIENSDTPAIISMLPLSFSWSSAGAQFTSPGINE